MRIAFFGSGAFGGPSLAALSQQGHDLCAVVTQPDRPAGRGRQPTPTPIKQLALQNRLPIIQPTDVNAWDVVAHVLGLQPQLAVVIAFGQRIGPQLLQGLNYKVINLHASLLPKYRGAAPINWAIIRGESQTGLTVFRLNERIDAGQILAQHTVPIQPGETAAELHDRLAILGPNLLGPVVQRFADGAEPQAHPQDESQATPAPKLKKSDGCIRFDQPAPIVAARICGLWSWPGAACRFVSADGARTEHVTLARALALPQADAHSLPPGTITDSMSVACLPGQIQLLQLRPAGGNVMSFQPDFVNGRHIRTADRFEPLM